MNFLIVRTDRIGDVVLTIPMIYFIREHSHDSKIFFMCSDYTSDLLKGNKEIDGLLIYDGQNSSFSNQLKQIKKLKIDNVFIVSPTFRLALIFFLARIPVRVGTGYRFYSFLFNRRVFQHRKYAEKHESEFNLDLLNRIGIKTYNDKKFFIPVSTEDIEKVKKILSENGAEKIDNLVVIHPGSGGSAMDLPEHKFVEIIECINRHSNVKIILTGGPGESNLLNRLASQSSKSIMRLDNVLNLRELAHLLQKSILFISNSTGPIHIAASMGTTVMGFYPPITACSERRWGPYTDKKYIFIPNKNPECKKCTKIKCAKFNCMDTISVSEVCNKIRSLLT